MRLKTTKSKNEMHFSIITDCKINGKRTTRVVENLGNLKTVLERAGGLDKETWIKSYILDLKKDTSKINITLNQNKKITMDQQLHFNGGYLFLQSLFYKLGMNRICNTISDKHKFTFNLSNVLSTLLYGRIIHPSSKLSTLAFSKTMIEQPNIEIQHIYRGLEILSKESDFIQSELYKNSLKVSKRNTSVLYYDCTNFFFETSEADGLRQYGYAKQKQGKPLVQLGLLMDSDGIPLSFCITPGNTNEQTTLKPLEKKVIKDFGLAKFVVCTDAGLASTANRKFNSLQDRAFITTQSVKKLKAHLKEWALSPDGWTYPKKDGKYNLDDIIELYEKDDDRYKHLKDVVFYKERWINEDKIEQRLIVTFSLKYRDYNKNIRQGQIDRANKLISSNPKKISKPRQNDFKRFISTINTTVNGEVADTPSYDLNQELIDEESKYDGLYAVCTNLDDEVSQIIKVNKKRWEIEETFRIMKDELDSRPVYLSKDERIEAHFITCVLAMVLFRYLEKELDNESFTYPKIISTLREYNYKHFPGIGYTPCFTRTELTDALEEKFNINGSSEIISEKNMKNFCKVTKQQKRTHFQDNKKTPQTLIK